MRYDLSKKKCQREVIASTLIGIEDNKFKKINLIWLEAMWVLREYYFTFRC